MQVVCSYSVLVVSLPSTIKPTSPVVENFWAATLDRPLSLASLYSLVLCSTTSPATAPARLLFLVTGRVAPSFISISIDRVIDDSVRSPPQLLSVSVLSPSTG